MAQTPKKIDDLLCNKFKEYLKVYLVLKYKGFSWQKELQNKFSIADSIVNESLKLLEKEGFVISKDYWSLDLDTQEIIKRTSGAYFEKINSFPKIYILNMDEIRTSWYDANREDIEALIKNDGSMEHTLKLIFEQKKAYDKLKTQFDLLEKTLNERKRIDPITEIEYFTKTKRAKLRDKEINESLMEMKKQNALEKQKKKLLGKSKNQNIILSDENKNENSLMINQGSSYGFGVLTHELNNVLVSKSVFDAKLRELEIIEKEDILIEAQLKKEEKIKSLIRESKDKGEDTPHIPGIAKTNEEINKEMRERLDNWEGFLGLKNEIDLGKNTELNSELEKKINSLIESLKSNKFLDVYYALDVLGSETNLKFFQEKIKDLPVKFDGDDFIYQN